MHKTLLPRTSRKELLVTCLLCGQGNFTVRGLRGHRCPAKPSKPGIFSSDPLTKEEWQEAVNAARREQ